MSKINWNKYKFHASSVKSLMVEPRLKSETLSETTKSYLKDIFIEEVYGRKKADTVANKYMRKGTMCETDSLELYEKVSGEKLFKNRHTLENDYFVGTPDIVKPFIKDIKTSWDLWTFTDVDEDKAYKDYYYQLLVYMDLTATDKAELIYCLVDTPDEITNDEMYRLSFYVSEEELEKYRNNFKFGDIKPELRVKKYQWDFNEAEIDNVKYKVKLARDYLKSLSL